MFLTVPAEARDPVGCSCSGSHARALLPALSGNALHAGQDSQSFGEYFFMLVSQHQ